MKSLKSCPFTAGSFFNCIIACKHFALMKIDNSAIILTDEEGDIYIMISLNDRQIEIIRCLLGRNEYVTIDSLSALFSVSKRTIQYDLSQIKFYFKKNGIEVISKPNHGIIVIATEEQKAGVKSILFQSKIIGADERRTAIALMLLVTDHTTYEAIAEICKVSKQTIITSFAEVDKEFGQAHIIVQKTKGNGLQVNGRESDIRHYFFKTIQENRIEDWIFQDILSKIYAEPYLSIARQIICDVENTNKIRYYDHRKLELSLCYLLNRTALDHVVPLQANERNDEEQYKDYLNILMKYPLQKSDKLMISYVLQNSSRRLIDTDMNEDDRTEARKLAEFLMRKLQLLHPLDDTSQKTFIRGLSTHLQVAINRMRSGVTVKNELLNQIKISIPLLYEYTKKELCEYEKILHIEFSENEIAYIAMYVASTYESSIKLDTKINVLLVCSFGLATSSILKTRMEQAIPECRILGPLSKYEADSYIKDCKVDLVISTNDVSFADIPVITVNPLIYQDDIDYIKNRLFQLSYSMMCSSFMKSYALQEQDEESICIHDLIAEKNIQIIDTCDTWKEAIETAAKPLLCSHDIEQSYVEKMIEAVLQLGTYMVLVPETAFIHAGTEDGIHRNCTAMLVLKNPIIFGNKNPKTVRFLVILGIKNKNDNSLLGIVNILANEDNRKILCAKDLNVQMIEKLH
jgi:transcriptional antiterminator/mannitol/fructose-specific phosphotransferase system IIA component